MTQQKPFLLGSKKEAVDYILDWLKADGPIRIDPHLKEDRKFRNVSVDDCKYVFSAVTENSLKWPPEWHESSGRWVLTIVGQDLYGHPVEMLFNIFFENYKLNVFNWLS